MSPFFKYCDVLFIIVSSNFQENFLLMRTREKEDIEKRKKITGKNIRRSVL